MYEYMNLKFRENLVIKEITIVFLTAQRNFVICDRFSECRQFSALIDLEPKLRIFIVDGFMVRNVQKKAWE